MRKVDQLIIDDVRGDCLRACVCTVLGLEPATVPNFSEVKPAYFEGVNVWLASHGLRFLYVSLTGSHAEAGGDAAGRLMPGYWFGYPGQNGMGNHVLVWGHGPRKNAQGGHRQHIVVCEPAGYGVKVAHDPHPSRDGLISVLGFGWIVPMGEIVL